jgi:conjugal transfer pilus assembly protein TraW
MNKIAFTQRLIQILIIFVLCLKGNSFVTEISYAADFGVIGQTFPITEESFIAMLKKRLDSVDIEKEQEKVQARAKEQIENPLPVSGITEATKYRVFYFDPSYTLDKDVVLPCGKILHKAGTKVNPLEHMDLNRRLFFIDGRKPKQVVWLKEQLDTKVLAQEQKEQVEDRIILVGGSVFKLKEILGQDHEDKVYFDQVGELTKKFGIKAVPALVEQEGLVLKIKEIKLE